MHSQDDWAVIFNETFSIPASAVQARIWTEVYGAEYPASLDTYSFVTVSELERMATELCLEEGDYLVDLGCGRGGPGLWMATQTGAYLIGLDIADQAVTASQERAESLGLAHRATFRVGTFESSGLADSSVRGVMSIDALLFTPDKRSALRELARVLAPTGRLVMTTWDYSSQPVGRPPQVEDHRPLFEEAGFAVHTYEETDQWRERMERTDALMFEAVDQLAIEWGVEPGQILTELSEAHDTLECMTRRVFIVAERLG